MNDATLIKRAEYLISIGEGVFYEELRAMIKEKDGEGLVLALKEISEQGSDPSCEKIFGKELVEICKVICL